MRTIEGSIFWDVYGRQGCLRSEIAERFAVSLATVSRAVDTLLKEQLLVEKKPAAGSLGRRPGRLHINPELANFLGLEIDRDRVTAAVTDMAGTLLGRGQFPCNANEGPKTVTDRALQAAEVALADARIGPRRVRRLGIGHPGLRDQAGEAILRWPGVVGWCRVPLRQSLAQVFGVEATLDDRARALALGERLTSPKDRDHPNTLYVHAGTGIGAGIFLEGRLWRGSDQLAGELGHQIIDREGPACTCGNRGCVEAFASIGAVLCCVREALSSGMSSELRGAADNDLDSLTLEMVAIAARRGDSLAVAALDRAAEALAIGIANVVKIFNPSLVVVSGRLAHAVRGRLTPRIQQMIRGPSFDFLSRSLRIRVAAPKKDIAAVGCALLAAEAEAGALLREHLYGPRQRSAAMFAT